MPTKTVRNSLMTMLAVALAIGGARAARSRSRAARRRRPRLSQAPRRPITSRSSPTTRRTSGTSPRRACARPRRISASRPTCSARSRPRSSEQQRFIEDILVQNFDGMAICAINPDAMTPLLDRVAAKMPVVVPRFGRAQVAAQGVRRHRQRRGGQAGRAGGDRRAEGGQHHQGQGGDVRRPHRHAELDRPQARHRRDAGQAARASRSCRCSSTAPTATRRRRTSRTRWRATPTW